MRKNIGVILIITSVLLFCGCLLDVGKQVYSSKSVSSLTTGSSINKSSILLIGDMSSFGENRLVEEKLKEKFSKKGINCIMTTDYLSGNEVDFSDKLYNLRHSLSYGFDMFITLTKSRVFTYGGGISDMETSVGVYKKGQTTRSLSMTVYTTCDDNKQKSYSETLDSCLDSLCDEIVSEYMKYCQ